MVFSLHWTGYNSYLTVNHTLFNQTCGLCGTFNYVRKDDRYLPGGQEDVGLDAFAKEWLVPDLSEDKCSTESVETSLDYCDIYLQNKNYSKEQCSVIKGNL